MIAYLLGAPATADALNSKRLVIINSYSDGAPWANEIVTPVMTEVSRLNELSAPEVVYLNNNLVHDSVDYNSMSRGIFERFKNRKPDYLVLVGNFAFTLRDAIVREWGEIPMLLVGQSDKYYPQEFYYTYLEEDADVPTDGKPLEELRGKYNFTLVMTPNLYRKTVDMMTYMFPEMKKLVYIADPLYLNRYLNNQIRNYLAESYPAIEYEWLMGSDANGEALQQYLNSRDNNIGLLLSTWFFERHSIHGYPHLIAGEARMITAARHPVFGLRQAYFSYGIIGGYFPSYDELQADIQKYLKELVSGRNMSEVPFKYVKESAPIINYQKLERSGIPESVCPPETVFLNKPMSVWEEYKWWFIIGGILLVCGIAFGMVKVMFQRRKIEMLRDREQLVSSMPIGFAQATVVHDSRGNVSDVEYHEFNESFQTLLTKNEQPGRPSKLFDNEMISGIVERLFMQKKPQRFSHYFAETDTYYEFLVSLGDTRKDARREIDIFSIDITNLKKQEEALREATEHAQESDKLKMAFLANMSHEIRTPLNAIVGFSNLLTKTNDEEKKKKFVGIIEHNNQMLLNLISDVLDMAKVESNTLDFNYRSTDINELMLTIESSVRLRLKPGVMLNLVLGAHRCNIITDPDRLDQVFNNLLTNALKFTSRGSITFGYEVRDENIYFYVRDTGTGISQEDIKKLFTRFTKLNNFIPGTGLGLSISRSIVERLGGQIRVESAGLNRGSTFWFTIPNRQAPV